MLEAIILNITRKFISGSNGLPTNIIFKQYFSENSFQTRKIKFVVAHKKFIRGKDRKL